MQLRPFLCWILAQKFLSFSQVLFLHVLRAFLLTAYRKKTMFGSMYSINQIWTRTFPPYLARAVHVTSTTFLTYFDTRMTSQTLRTPTFGIYRILWWATLAILSGQQILIHTESRRNGQGITQPRIVSQWNKRTNITWCHAVTLIHKTTKTPPVFSQVWICYGAKVSISSDCARFQSRTMQYLGQRRI